MLEVMVNPEHAKKTAIPGAAYVRLVIVLCDQLIEDISRADNALVHCSAEQCATDIGHALAVIGYLQATIRQNGKSRRHPQF